MIQPDSNRSEVLIHEDVELFINLLPSLENRISTIVQQLKKPLNHIIPVDFQAHLEKAKSINKIDQEWIEKFKDVVALKIQGRINIPLMRLAQQLRLQFGGQTIFWLDVLCCFADNEKYHENLRIWQISDAQKASLHLPIGEYEKNRHFRRLAKHDINSTKKLISSIYQLSFLGKNQEGSKKAPEDIIFKVQMNYKLHQESSKKVVQFLKSQKEKCLQFFEQSNLSYPGKKTPASQISNNSWSKKTKEKERLNNPKQKMITDFSVQMVDSQNTQLLKKIVGHDGKLTDPQKTSQLDRLFINMSYQEGQVKPNIQKLRQQMIQSKLKLLPRPQSIYSNIFIAYSYIKYQQFPNLIESSPFKYFDNPYLQHEQINYGINDYELFEQNEADRISQTDSEEDSQDDTLDSREKMYFYNEDDDGYEMDQEDRFVQNTAFRNCRLFEGNQWVLNFKDQNPFRVNHKVPEILKQDHQPQLQGQSHKFPQYNPTPKPLLQLISEFDATIICPYPTPMPINLQQQDQKLTIQDESKLKQIFHGRSKQQALEIIKASDQLLQKFSKDKIRNIISTMTKKRIRNNQGKYITVYFISQEHKQNFFEDLSVEKASITANDNGSLTQFDQPETAAHDQEYKPIKSVSINSNSRSSSQRISNINLVSFKSQIQHKSQSQSSSVSDQAVSVTVSNRFSQNSKREFLRESKWRSQQTVTNPPVSRLRPRNSKPNYNLEAFFNDEEKKSKDIEI